MSEYIEVTNNSKVIINDYWHNLALKSKISSVTIGSSYTVSKQAQSDLVFVHCYTAGCSFYTLNYKNYSVITTMSSGVFDIYLYGETTTNNSSGLAVYNSSGAQIFNSGLKYMKVIGCTSSTGTFSYGNKIAIACGFQWEEDETGAIFNSIAYKMLTDRSFSTVVGPYDSETENPVYWHGDFPVVVINVDGA